MQFPEQVLDIVREETEANGSDIAQAAKNAVVRVSTLPDYKAIVENLIYQAIRDLVYDTRHALNVRMKRESGYYDSRTMKVNSGSAEGVQEACRSVYSYYVGGTMLGDITGEQLEGLASHEDEIAKGHEFNARLLRWLSDQGVTGVKKVREVVPEKKLQLNFRRIWSQVQKGAA